MERSLNKAILREEVQEFIRSHLHSTPAELVLKGSPFPDVTGREIANQVSGLQKARTKLPSWYLTRNIIFPPNLNLEQSSSEVTAQYKASLISGESLIDLTGGLGIDTYYFAERFNRVLYWEKHRELSEIAEHNFQVLSRINITCYTGDSVEQLHLSSAHFDWIYLDPARRDTTGGKVFLLEQCTPNVPEHLELFFERSPNILIKTSPLLDISAGIRDLKRVSEIHIVSVNNEVKEMLWVLHKNSSLPVRLKTVNFLKEQVQEFETVYHAQEAMPPLSAPLEYMYEPNPAVMKGGMFTALAHRTGTAKLHSNSHLYTSSSRVSFPGRGFKIKAVVAYNKKSIKTLGLTKANITTRNFPKTVEAIRKEFKIKEGGEHYVFFTTNLRDEKIILIGEKLEG